MASQSQWSIVPVGAAEQQTPLFFTEHEWNTVEAATARIIPTDRDPGAREARVVLFLDRFLSSIQFIYASADGSGFLQMSGKDAEAWEERIAHRQQVYREGIAQMDELSGDRFGKPFVELTPDEQDDVLEALSGQPRPRPVSLEPQTLSDSGVGGPPPTNQPVSDESLGFFDMLVLHTRQGFYADPAYGGNKDFIGWRVIGYPGPESLADTVAGRYTTVDYMIPEATWPYAQHPAVQRYRVGQRRQA
jgi:gluconate 2-dehydrogenase gamma chain